MTDLQKVIKGMECCIISDEESECPDACPYYDECWKDECWKDESWKDEFVIGLALRKDALELLKQYAEVMKQGRDRRGYTTTRRCMVVKGERAKRLQYFDTWDGGYLPIRELDGIDHLYYVETEV